MFGACVSQTWEWDVIKHNSNKTPQRSEEPVFSESFALSRTPTNFTCLTAPIDHVDPLPQSVKSFHTWNIYRIITLCECLVSDHSGGWLQISCGSEVSGPWLTWPSPSGATMKVTCGRASSTETVRSKPRPKRAPGLAEMIQNVCWVKLNEINLENWFEIITFFMTFPWPWVREYWGQGEPLGVLKQK